MRKAPTLFTHGVIVALDAPHGARKWMQLNLCANIKTEKLLRNEAEKVGPCKDVRLVAPLRSSKPHRHTPIRCEAWGSVLISVGGEAQIRATSERTAHRLKQTAPRGKSEGRATGKDAEEGQYKLVCRDIGAYRITREAECPSRTRAPTSPSTDKEWLSWLNGKAPDERLKVLGKNLAHVVVRANAHPARRDE
jgi:hypothetical protein